MGSSRSGDQGSAVQQLATTNVKNVRVNHHRHKLFENRVARGTLSPQIAKSFSGHIARDRYCHMGGCCWAAHPLVLELLYDVMEKGLGCLVIENVEAHHDRRILAGFVTEPFRVEIVDRVSMSHDPAELQRNVTDFEDQEAAAANFMLRIVARESQAAFVLIPTLATPSR